MEKANKSSNLDKNMKIPKIKLPSNNNTNKSNSKTSNTNSKNIQTEKDAIDKVEKLQNLNKIFLSNSQYNTKEKDYFMNRFQIIEVLKNSKIISKGIISKTQADIILTQLNPHKRKYNLIDFINYLTEICHYIYKGNFEIAPKETMDYFLNCLFNNINDYLEEKNSKNFLEKNHENTCTIKCIETIIISNIKRPIIKLLLSLIDSFVKIYKVYFQNELTNNVIINKELMLLNSSENLLKFATDFEISPYIINKTNLNTYFNILIRYQFENPELIKDIMNSYGDKKYKDIGIIFKLSSFILFIYHFTFFLYYKDFKTQKKEDNNCNYKYEDNNCNLDDIEKVILFLQKLENSGGIKKYLKKRERTNENKFTFIPSKKTIEIVNEEIKNRKNENTPNDIKKSPKKDNKNNRKYDIESSPYTSGEVTERKIDNLNNTYANSLKASKSFYIIKDDNLNDYYKEKIKKEDYYISTSELKKILNVSPSIKTDIINNIENLSEIFLKYSQIHGKLEYNRMTISSFIEFLKDANILSVIPQEKKSNYRKLSNKIIRRNYNISEVKKFNNTLKLSISASNINLTKEEKNYKKNLSNILNTNNFTDKINIGEASVIFFSLTNTNNFPYNLNNIRTQFDRNTGYKNINMNSYIQKTFSFDMKRYNFKQKNIPNKMNLILFIKSFELISSKLYPDMTLDDAVSNLLNKKIIPFIREKKIDIIDSKEIKDALAKMNNESIKTFLIKLGDVIYPLYRLYSDNSGNMKFYQLFDFYKNFDIFPELISLPQMKMIFFTLCESSSTNSESNNTKSSQRKTEQIDFSLFLESLGITSMFFNFKDIVSDIDRLLYICYFIWKSDGIKKQKIGENVPQKINRSFIELFKKYNRDEIYNNGGIESDSKNSYKKILSNPNFNENKLVMTYNKENDEYNCSPPKRTIYKFDDIYT